MFSRRDKTQIPAPDDALPGRATSRIRVPPATSCSTRRSSRRSPRVSSRRSSGSAASGARSASSGRPTASTRPPSATRAASRRTRPTKRSAAAAPVTTKSCSSCSIPSEVELRRDLLRVFWESHDPTQGMRQGNDVGTQYRSGIYCFDDRAARGGRGVTRRCSRSGSTASGYGDITTEILDAPTFFYAEDYHQQYLAKNPMGYCGLGGTGVSCPIGGPRGRVADRRRVDALTFPPVTGSSNAPVGDQPVRRLHAQAVESAARGDAADARRGRISRRCAAATSRSSWSEVEDVYLPLVAAAEPAVRGDPRPAGRDRDVPRSRSTRACRT